MFQVNHGSLSFSNLTIDLKIEKWQCRWRKLEGSDPATYELLQKVHLLHRRLIRGSEMLVERDLQIKAKEQLCQELQAVARRAPGPDAARKLLMTQVRCLSPLEACAQ